VVSTEAKGIRQGFSFLRASSPNDPVHGFVFPAAHYNLFPARGIGVRQLFHQIRGQPGFPVMAGKLVK
jgi:hypothetical protein